MATVLAHIPDALLTNSGRPCPLPLTQGAPLWLARPEGGAGLGCGSGVCDVQGWALPHGLQGVLVLDATHAVRVPRGRHAVRKPKLPPTQATEQGQGCSAEGPAAAGVSAGSREQLRAPAPSPGQSRAASTHWLRSGRRVSGLSVGLPCPPSTAGTRGALTSLASSPCSQCSRLEQGPFWSRHGA